jgi:hypothetical protein
VDRFQAGRRTRVERRRLDKTHRRLLPYHSSHAMPEFSEVEQTAPKLTITVWALVTPYTQRRF